MIRKYRMICLKRSEADTVDGYFRWTKPIYWRPNYAGYTDNLVEAGIYTAQEVEKAGGKRGDWLLEPLNPEEYNRETTANRSSWTIVEPRGYNGHMKSGSGDEE